MRRVAIWYFVFVVLGMPANGCTRQAQKTAPKELAMLSALDAETRSNAATEVRVERRKTIQKLLELSAFEGEQNYDIRQKAISLLGAFPDSEAADFLVARVATEFDYFVSIQDPAGNFVSVRSLREMGNPVAWRAILGRLHSPLSKQEQALFVAVIKDIDGHDVGLFRLKKELEKDHGTIEMEENLKAMVAMYESEEYTKYFFAEHPQEERF